MCNNAQKIFHTSLTWWGRAEPRANISTCDIYQILNTSMSCECILVRHHNKRREGERDKVSELYPEDTFLRLGTAAARHWDLSPDSEALENFKAAAMHQHNLPSSFWNRQCLSSTSTMDFCVHAIFQPEHTISLQTPNCSDKKSTFACDNVCNPSSSK